MPPPNRFWVILIGETATSFKGKEREDLLPTYKQLQRTQSGVSLRWFERGRIWESPDAAEGAAKLALTEGRTKRPKEWRPGGEHVDPKARFQLSRDQKRAKFKKRLIEDSIASSASPFGPRKPRDDKSSFEKSPFERRPEGKDPGVRGSVGPGVRESMGPGVREPRRERPSGSPMENPFKKSGASGGSSGGGSKPLKRKTPASR
ncbi:MAG: hypothetical protein HQ485_07720 [Acidobacteria bacterium]|nr:hypothetical protein [Acidobacteriota bacterium]